MVKKWCVRANGRQTEAKREANRSQVGQRPLRMPRNRNCGGQKTGSNEAPPPPGARARQGTWTLTQQKGFAEARCCSNANDGGILAAFWFELILRFHCGAPLTTAQTSQLRRTESGVQLEAPGAERERDTTNVNVTLG